MGVTNRAATVAGAVKASGGRYPLWRRLTAIAPMLRDSFTGRWTSAPRFRLLLSMLGLVYVVSPIDLMPEILLGPFGLGDDLAIAVVAVAALMSSAEEWLDREAAVGGDSPSQPFPPSDPTAPGAGDVVEGVVLDRN